MSLDGLGDALVYGKTPPMRAGGAGGAGGAWGAGGGGGDADGGGGDKSFPLDSIERIIQGRHTAIFKRDKTGGIDDCCFSVRA